MYRRGKFRRDVLSESCAAILGIDARLAEIDDLLQHGRAASRAASAARRCFRGTHFCPNCGRRRELAGRAGARRRRTRSSRPARPPTVADASGRRASAAGRRRCSPPSGRAHAAARRAMPRSAYCIECGLRLPELHGRRRVVPPPLGAPDRLVPGRLGLGRRCSRSSLAPPARRPRSSSAGIARSSSAPLVATSRAAATRHRRSRPSAANGHLAWPARRSGWTVVLASYPEPQGPRRPPARPPHARPGAKLRQVGTLDSSNYASLNPGYDVVFSGIYGSAAEAQAALGTRSASRFWRRAFRANRPLTAVPAFTRSKTFVTPPRERVESPSGRGRRRRSNPVSDKVCWHNCEEDHVTTMDERVLHIQHSMYQYSRAIYRSIKDLIDPYAGVEMQVEYRREVLSACEANDGASRRRSVLLLEARQGALPGHPPLLPDHRAGRSRLGRDRGSRPRRCRSSRIRSRPARSTAASSRCRATTRKGKPCQRTPLPEREYCPSHQHLERSKVAA